MGTRSIAFFLLLAGVSFCAYADSRAYVVTSALSDQTPGSLSRFTLNGSKSTVGPGIAVPAGGGAIAVPTGTNEVWQVTSNSVDVYDATTGAAAATIGLSQTGTNIVIDNTGTYAYVKSGTSMSKISVAAKTIVLSGSTSCATFGPLVISEDGSQLFCDSDGGIQVLYTSTFATQATLVGSNSFIVSGPTLFAATTNAVICYDTATLQLVATVPAPSGYNNVFGGNLTTGEIYLWINNTIFVENLSGTILKTETYTTDQYANAVLSPDGTQIVVADSPLLVVDAATLAVTGTVEWYGVPSGTFLNDSTYLLLATQVSVMTAVDQGSASVTSTILTSFDFCYSAVASPAGKLVYAGSSSFGTPGNLAVVNTSTNEVTAILPVSGFTPTALAHSQLYGFSVVNFFNGSTYTNAESYNLLTGELTVLVQPVNPYVDYELLYGALISPPSGATVWTPYSLRYSGPSNAALKAIARQGIVLYRGLDGKLLGTIPTPQAVTAIVFSSDSSKAYVGELNSIVVYDAVKFKTLLTIADATTPTALAVSPDGTTVYAADGSTIQSFNTATGALLNTFAIPATELAISPDGSTLWAAQFSSTTLNLLNTQTSVVTPVTLPYVATALVVVSGSD